MKNEIEINSTHHALKYLYELSLTDSNLCFRGHAGYSWDLVPLIHRYYNFKRYQTVRHEEYLLQNKPSPNPPLIHTKFDLEWLMTCQHYGIPTRLLDWSKDILVALLFACSNLEHDNKDGALFVCNINEYPIFDNYSSRAVEIKKLSFINTNITNPRMRLQNGCFMIWGHSPLNPDDSKETYDLWQFHDNNQETYFIEKIRIPKSSKEQIRKELNEFYALNYDDVLMKNGFFDLKYGDTFNQLKDNLRLMTMHVTASDELSEDENKKAEKFFRIKVRDRFKGTISNTY